MDDSKTKSCSCHLPCDERIYDVAVSASGPWPHQSYRRAFYDQFVNRNRYRQRLNRFAHDKVAIVSFMKLNNRYLSFYRRLFLSFGPRCKFTTGRQNQDRSRLLTNHRRRRRDRWRQVLHCNLQRAPCLSASGATVKSCR